MTSRLTFINFSDLGYQCMFTRQNGVKEAILKEFHALSAFKILRGFVIQLCRPCCLTSWQKVFHGKSKFLNCESDRLIGHICSQEVAM